MLKRSNLVAGIAWKDVVELIAVAYHPWLRWLRRFDTMLLVSILFLFFSSVLAAYPFDGCVDVDAFDVVVVDEVVVGMTDVVKVVDLTGVADVVVVVLTGSPDASTQ